MMAFRLVESRRAEPIRQVFFRKVVSNGTKNGKIGESGKNAVE
jgi:hypothetical protein